MRPHALFSTSCIALAMAVAVVPSALSAQDAAAVLETMEAKQAERYSTVDNYTITKAIEVAGGAQAPMYFEKFTAADGAEHFRFVLPSEYSRDMSAKSGFPPPNPDQLDQFAGAYDMVGGALSTGGGDMPPMPGASLMMGAGGMFLRAAADAERNENDGRADAVEAAQQMEEFKARARLDGRETLDLRQAVREVETEAAQGDPDAVSWIPDAALTTRDAFLLVADDLSDLEIEQPEGGTFTLKRASLWIDAEHYVPLRLRMEAEVEGDEGKQTLTIEKFSLDYRQVGPLLEPFAEVLHLSGIMGAMSEKERREMEKARKDLARAKEQLEKMPPAQRAMAERMMRGQLEKAEKMLAGGAMVTSIRTVSVAVNEGPPTPYGLGSLELAGTSFPGVMTIATEGEGEGGTEARIDVAARDGDVAEASFGLVATGEFPPVGGTVAIADADGWARYGAEQGIGIEGGSGEITVTERTETRIRGTFTATLRGTGDGGPVTIPVSGEFDSGAPDRAPRGSPFPANMFEMGPPPGSPAVESRRP